MAVLDRVALRAGLQVNAGAAQPGELTPFKSHPLRRMARVRKSVDEWREVAPCMLGDYYPLTPYSLEPTPWMAWQFDLPAERRGVVQVFRRPESPHQMATFPLQALDPRATYEVIDLDSPAERKQVAGRELVEQGLSVTLSHRPSSAVVLYRQVAVPLGPPAWPSQ